MPYLTLTGLQTGDGETADQSSPSMGVDPDGNAYAVCVDYRDGNWDIYFSHRQGQICAEEEFVRALGRLALLGSGLALTAL